MDLLCHSIAAQQVNFRWKNEISCNLIFGGGERGMCTLLPSLLYIIELLSRCEWFSVCTHIAQVPIRATYMALCMPKYLRRKSVFGDRRLICFLIPLFERRQWTRCHMDWHDTFTLLLSHLEDFDMWITRSMIFARALPANSLHFAQYTSKYTRTLARK